MSVESTSSLNLYAYGSASPNPGQGGYAATWSSDQQNGRVSGGYRHSTCVRLAMIAVIEGLRHCPDADLITIHSDQQYLVEAFQRGGWRAWRQNGWRRGSAKGGALQNVDLWERLLAAIGAKTGRITWRQADKKCDERKRCKELALEARSTTNLAEDLRTNVSSSDGRLCVN
ncbi:Ribonuclease H [Botrimarina colliarenosi]|uniref:Ribonuclease H n=1 Tax=Botrimarina colliarenosi TaxID=2528001 RepID=A0A5C5ZW34_9BACT|nr:RNase H family protein [Botrimarina colliarenosi]TWT91794.1 Ribonuclease H [Botrimarina colliarenosi]